MNRSNVSGKLCAVGCWGPWWGLCEEKGETLRQERHLVSDIGQARAVISSMPLYRPTSLALLHYIAYQPLVGVGRSAIEAL